LAGRLKVALPAMIADFPGSAEQKKRAEKATMRFIE
jgi:hypothetical protein